MMKPYETIQGDAQSSVLFLCDHASSDTPPEYERLGLPEAQFQRHIAYDIGAAAAARWLAAHFRAPAILGGFSRLLIDANRGADDPTLVMRLSDGAIIPGNAAVGEAEIERRRAQYWQPYRDCIASRIAAMRGAGIVPAIVSIHSYTPVWKNYIRPWQMAVLWDADDRLAAPLIAGLRSQGVSVGDNEPYDGALEGDTLYDHATLAGLPNALVEFRQDLVGDEYGAQKWAAILAEALAPVLAEPRSHMIEYHPSRTAKLQELAS